MKNLIIQYYIDTNLYTQPNFNNLYASPAEQYSSHSFQIYCKKHGIDYIKITKPKLGFKHPTWERFDLWIDQSWRDQYDRILYVDSDVFVLPHATNIFDEYPDLDTFKAAVYKKYRQGTPEQCKEITKDISLFNDINGEDIKTKFIQPGVFMLNKKCIEDMLPYISQYKDITDDKIDDGMFLNYCIVKSGVSYKDMMPQWNFKNNGCEKFNKKSTYFLHAAGGKKHKKGNMWNLLNNIYPEINADLSQFSN
jgi:hypothetical protein